MSEVANQRPYTEEEAMRILHIASHSTMRELRRRRAIGYYRIGRTIVYGDHHITAYLEAREVSSRARAHAKQDNCQCSRAA